MSPPSIPCYDAPSSYPPHNSCVTPTSSKSQCTCCRSPYRSPLSASAALWHFSLSPIERGKKSLDVDEFSAGAHLRGWGLASPLCSAGWCGATRRCCMTQSPSLTVAVSRPAGHGAIPARLASSDHTLRSARGSDAARRTNGVFQWRPPPRCQSLTTELRHINTAHIKCALEFVLSCTSVYFSEMTKSYRLSIRLSFRRDE